MNGMAAQQSGSPPKGNWASLVPAAAGLILIRISGSSANSGYVLYVVDRWSNTQSGRRRLSPLTGLATLVLTVVALYWGKPVLVPLTIAILLTFLLSPVVDFLHRARLSRTVAVIVVVFLVFSFLGAVAYAMGRQVTMLAAEIPQYKDNIVRKISDFRAAGRSRVLERLNRTWREIVGEIERQNRPIEGKQPDAVRGEIPRTEEQPVPVIVRGDRTPGRLLPAALGSAMEWLVNAAMVVVLVIFMLLRLQELRNRLIRVIGYSRLTSTTRALDDAGARISRYLLMQSIINTTYGLSVGIGLFAIGLPYAVLLGFIAGTTRFIPYIGPPLGAVLPVALSLALSDGWMGTLLVLALFGLLEAVTSMVLEPRLYGQSAGVSEVALLVAIAFWTWVWGPIGLALATPLTVCLVVLCKHIPELEFVEALLGDAPVDDPPLVYYQRLLARDTDEAADVLHAFLKDNPAEQVYDRVLLPVLQWVKRDAARDKLSADDVRFICQTTRDLLEGLERKEPSPAAEGAAVSLVRIAGIPARDSADELALHMLAHLLDARRFALEVYSSEKMLSEIIAGSREVEPDIICLAALAPDPLTPTRNICKRLRDCFPAARIVVCRNTIETTPPQSDPILAAGADFVAGTLLEIRNCLVGLLPVVARKTPEAAPARAGVTAAQAA